MPKVLKEDKELKEVEDKLDTQELKEGYFANQGDTRSLAVMTNWGALNFFIMFYNMVMTLQQAKDGFAAPVLPVANQP